MKGISYSNINRMRIPNLLPEETGNLHLGKYALLRANYLKKEKKILYTNLLTAGKLKDHLLEFQDTATKRMQLLTEKMAKEEELTESLKEKDPMKWAGLMTNIKMSAEESILKDLIYS